MPQPYLGLRIDASHGPSLTVIVFLSVHEEQGTCSKAPVLGTKQMHLERSGGKVRNQEDRHNLCVFS